MFKITGRIVLILLAACLVSGVLYLLVNGTAGQPGLLSSLDRGGGFDRGFRLTGNPLANAGSLLVQTVTSPLFRSNFGDGGFRNRYSLWRGLSSVIGDLMIVALITVLVVLVHGVIKKALSHPPEKSA
jgi:hypothetical protein